MNLDRSHLPPLREATALGTLRSRFIMMDTVNSAAEVVLPPGVFTTCSGQTVTRGGGGGGVTKGWD